MKTRYSLALAALALPTLALAHPGHDAQTGFVAGVMHPLTGLDHLAAMLAVGVWAAQLSGKLRWAVPASFVGLMLLGALASFSGFAINAAEQGIAASVCVFGLLLAGAIRLPAVACVLLTGAFALFHGYAHGAEAPQQGSALLYMSGFVLSTVALHGAGFVVAQMLARHQQQSSLRWVGAAMAVGGLALFAA
ncbi:MAG: HupE/UreJ family protein [Steroidobacteraceae bacterium]